MLVLSRKPGERIMVGEEIAITVVRIGPNAVRLGIEAPRDMNIVREELCRPESSNSVGTVEALRSAERPLGSLGKLPGMKCTMEGYPPSSNAL